MLKNLLTIIALVSLQAINAQCVDETLITDDVICPGIYAPVCGCNGVTYSNSCEAQNWGGLTEWTEGQCSQLQECNDLGDIDFGMCAMFLGYALYNGQCSGVSGCGYIVDNIDYSDSFYETESNCIEQCGNEAILCVDVGNVDFGMCDMWLGYAVVNGQCSGLSGCGYIVDNVDYSDHFFIDQQSCNTSCGVDSSLCTDLGIIDFGLCDMALGIVYYNGQCVSLSGCGYVVDGVDYSPYFYQSMESCVETCGALQPCSDLAGIDFGACNMFMGYAMLNGTCAGIGGCGYIVEGIDYAPAFYSSLLECSQACHSSQECINPIQIEWGQVIDCAPSTETVCGCDGITYINDCHAFYVGGVVTYAQGPCLKNQITCQAIPSFVNFGDCQMALGWAYTSEGCVLTSGCSYTGNNGYDYSDYFFSSEYQCNSLCIDTISINCIDEDLIDSLILCTSIYEPVCGCDNVTYANECVAQHYNGITMWSPGECFMSSINDIDTESLLIYPNPAQSILTIRSENKTILVGYEIYDLAGKMIAGSSLNSQEISSIDIASFSPGVYVLATKTNSGHTQRNKFIKQ